MGMTQEGEDDYDLGLSKGKDISMLIDNFLFFFLGGVGGDEGRGWGLGVTDGRGTVGGGMGGGEMGCKGGGPLTNKHVIV